MTEHKHFPQAEIGTGKFLCRDCDELLEMSAKDIEDFRARVVAIITGGVK